MANTTPIQPLMPILQRKARRLSENKSAPVGYGGSKRKGDAQIVKETRRTAA